MKDILSGGVSSPRNMVFTLAALNLIRLFGPKLQIKTIPSKWLRDKDLIYHLPSSYCDKAGKRKRNKHELLTRYLALSQIYRAHLPCVRRMRSILERQNMYGSIRIQGLELDGKRREVTLCFCSGYLSVLFGKETTATLDNQFAYHTLKGMKCEANIFAIDAGATRGRPAQTRLFRLPGTGSELTPILRNYCQRGESWFSTSEPFQRLKACSCEGGGGNFMPISSSLPMAAALRRRRSCSEISTISSSDANSGSRQMRERRASIDVQSPPPKSFPSSDQEDYSAAVVGLSVRAEALLSPENFIRELGQELTHEPVSPHAAECSIELEFSSEEEGEGPITNETIQTIANDSDNDNGNDNDNDASARFENPSVGEDINCMEDIDISPFTSPPPLQSVHTDTEAAAEDRIQESASINRVPSAQDIFDQFWKKYEGPIQNNKENSKNEKRKQVAKENRHADTSKAIPASLWNRLNASQRAAMSAGEYNPKPTGKGSETDNNHNDSKKDVEQCSGKQPARSLSALELRRKSLQHRRLRKGY